MKLKQFIQFLLYKLNLYWVNSIIFCTHFVLGPPVEVGVTMHIIGISSVSEVQMVWFL
jgi:hypothetical protein